MMRRPWLTTLLLIAGALALAYNVKVYSEIFATPKASAKPPASLETAVDVTEDEPRRDATEAAPLAPLAQASLDAFLAGLPAQDRDPFRFASEQAAPVVASGDAPKLPTVEGVLIGEGRRVAFIDGRARSEGEEVNGHRIVRIEAARVVLLSEGREVALTPAR